MAQTKKWSKVICWISSQVQQHSPRVCADIPRGGVEDAVPGLRPHHPGCRALRRAQLLHLRDAEESPRRSVLLQPASFFLLLTPQFLICFHPPLIGRAKRALPAVLLRALGVRGVRGSDRPVGVVPPGRGTTAHADRWGHGPHVRHHPGHHEGDRVWGGADTRTLQRSEHELGQRAHRRGDQLHHLWPHPDHAKEAAPDALHRSVARIRRGSGEEAWLRSGMCSPCGRQACCSLHTHVRPSAIRWVVLCFKGIRFRNEAGAYLSPVKEHVHTLQCPYKSLQCNATCWLLRCIGRFGWICPFGSSTAPPGWFHSQRDEFRLMSVPTATGDKRVCFVLWLEYINFMLFFFKDNVIWDSLVFRNNLLRMWLTQTNMVRILKTRFSVNPQM